MQTREKFGTQARRFFKVIYDNRQEILTFKRIITLGREQVMTDTRKLIDMIFMFEGIGFITRISKNKFIFTGFRGVTNRIIEGLLAKLKKGEDYNRENWLFSEEIKFDRTYSIRQSVYIGYFYQEVLCTVLSIPTKTMSREAIEKLLEQLLPNLLKEQTQLLVLNEMISVMTTLNLLEKRNPMDNRSEQFEIYQWNGPDIFNNKGLQIDQTIFSSKLKESLQSRIILNYEKEKLYYQFIFRDWGIDTQQKAIISTSTQIMNLQGICDIPKQPLSHFPKLSFGMLKGKNWSFLIQKLITIIGRANPSPNSGRAQKYRWEVDVELDSSNRTSKQHAVIGYNFEGQYFEIRCLSSKKPIMVDSVSLSHHDKPLPLINKTQIQICKESFMFFLPKPFQTLNITTQVMEEDNNKSINHNLEEQQSQAFQSEKKIDQIEIE